MNGPAGLRFLFDCGAFTDSQLRPIRLEDGEIDEHRFTELAEATGLLSGPIRRRVAAAACATRCLYLEDGRSVCGIDGKQVEQEFQAAASAFDRGLAGVDQ